MATDKVVFTSTEVSAREVFERYPMPRATRREIAQAANKALRVKWESEAAARLGEKGDSFSKWAAFSRRNPALTRLALFVPIEAEAMAAVELEDA